MSYLKKVDPEIYDAIYKETQREQNKLDTDCLREFCL